MAEQDLYIFESEDDPSSEEETNEAAEEPADTTGAENQAEH